MEALFFYFGKMIICSALMSAYYLLFLRDRTFHHYNRFYLLVTVVVSILLPLLKVEYFTIETDSRILLLINQLNAPVQNQAADTFDFWTFLAAVLGIVSLFFLAKIMLGLVKINQLKKEFPKENIEGITFYNTNLHDAPFSFFKNLFWKKSILLHSDLGKQILKHEMVHIEQKHSVDKLFIQILQSVFWFNPVFYFIKKEINLIHEYLADKKAVKHSDTKAFAQMLLASNFFGNVLPATSPFLSSNLKKRLHMLTKKTTKYSYARRILALPILFAVSFTLLVHAKNKEIKKQNQEIALAVKQIKKDTIKPDDIQKMIQTQQEKLNKASEKLKKDNEKIKLLGEETRKKSDELQKIAKEKGAESYEYELKSKELKQLGHELDKIANSNEAKKNRQELSFNLEELDKIFNSDDFKNKFKFDDDKIKDLEVKIKKGMKDGNVIIKNIRVPEDFDGVMAPPVPPVPSIEMDRYRAEAKAKLSAEDQKKLEKLNKEREGLAKKQAELSKKQAELAKKEAEITGIKMRYWNNEIIDLPNKERIERIRLSAPRIRVSGFNSSDKGAIDDNVKIYINEKPSTKEEMNKLKPEDIVRMDVNKTNTNGKENNEIRIQTK